MVMEQRQFQPMQVTDQIAILMATNEGLLDGLDTEKNKKAQEIIASLMNTDFKDIAKAILDRQKLDDKTKQKMLTAFERALKREKVI